MPRRTSWAAAAAALALSTSIVLAGGTAYAEVGSVAGVRPGSEVGSWAVTQVAPGQYDVAWTSPTALPVTSDRPTVVGAAGWTVGPPTTDGRTVRARVGAPVRPTVADLDVVLSGQTLDEPGFRPRRTTTPAPPPDPVLDLPGTRTLDTDPATPGPFAVVSSDYSLDPLPVPGLAEPVEMVGHVVEPAADAATGPRPLVLFLHGRHGYCYDPETGADASSEWPCVAPSQEIPSHLGYDYLQRLLASQGYATVSIRANGINAQDDALPDGGADARARLVLAHLDLWAGQAAQHQVDLAHVVLVGHSRGGEGVARAAIRTPLGAAYRIVGQVLVAPTDFGSQAAPYVPSVTLLPYCDGDVSDLQGQRYTDTTRDLVADDTAFRSSVLVMGANHNFFNTEWTPATATADAEDDWYGAAGETCGRQDPARLKPTAQRAVGAAYVAGAVHLFARGDQSALPLFDGSRARVVSQGRAQTLSHAVGGGRVLRTPVGSTSLALADGASTRFCRGVMAPGRIAACGNAVADLTATPMWMRAGEAVPPHDFLEMSWTAAGQSGGLLLREPLDLTGRRLELRTIVDTRSGVGLRVRLTDATGATAVLDPAGGPQLPGLGRSAEVRKLWAQAVVVDPTGAGLDLAHVVRVDLVAASDRGRVWLADLASAPDRLTAVPDRRLPTVDVGELRVVEGDGGPRTARVPVRVNGTLTEPARIVVSTVGQAPGDAQRFTVDLAPGQTSASIPVAYDADDRADYPRLVTQVSAWSSRGVVTDRYAGGLTVVDDDPLPDVRIRPVARTVVEGRPAQWRIRLSRAVDFDVPVIGRVVRGPQPRVRVGDLPADWTDVYVGEVDPGKPLWRTHPTAYEVIPPGERSVVLSIPTRADRLDEPDETLTLRIRAEHHRVVRTVRIVSRSVS